MENVENLIKTTMHEIEKMLSSKTVVGDPIVVENNTIIPLVSVGFGFGAGSDKSEGGGTGGGGGIKPVAILVVNKDGVRLEPIKSATSSVLEKVVDTVGEVARKSKKDKEESSK